MDSRPSTQQGSTVGPSDAATASGSTTTREKGYMLRDLDTSKRFPGSVASIAGLQVEVLDKGADGDHRRLQKNELLTMILNEIAVEEGYGFFMHLRNRDGWRKKMSEGLCPSNRALAQPGYTSISESGEAKLTIFRANFPSIIYMEFSWNANAQDDFWSRSHRSRYLSCDALINTPHDNTPLYAIQCIEHAKFPIFAPSTEAMIILTTPAKLYLTTSNSLEDLLGGWSLHKRKPQGPDPEMRLNTAQDLWRKEDREETAIRERMALVETPDIKTIYNRVGQWCQTGGLLPSTFTALAMLRTVPRPAAASIGLPLGTASGFEGSDPPSRRGEYQNIERRAKTLLEPN